MKNKTTGAGLLTGAMLGAIFGAILFDGIGIIVGSLIVSIIFGYLERKEYSNFPLLPQKFKYRFIILLI